jgi:RNA polymerase sigma-B factor
VVREITAAMSSLPDIPGAAKRRSRAPHRHLSAVLSHDQIDDLFRRWRDGRDHRARAQLVHHYLPLATGLARRYPGAGEPPDDLKQVASLGLLKAIDRYDPERGINFKTYAVPTILGEIKKYFRDYGWTVRVPRGTQDLALEIEQAQRTMLTRTGRPPTFEELANYLAVPLETVNAAVEAAGAHHAISIDAPRTDGDTGSVAIVDTLGGCDDAYERVENHVLISQACQQLTERQREVVALRLKHDLTQKEIAAELGVSQMQISRILQIATDRLSEILQDSTHTVVDL